MTELAINGGAPVRRQKLPRYTSIGQAEIDSVVRVMRTGVLSKYLGCWDPDFYGGDEVQALEREWAQYFGVRHAVSMNSNSSGLHAALGASGVGLGDEVLVTPLSMCVSATAPLVWNATPVFVDVDPETFCMDPSSIRARITSRTKAILVVHLFGCPADMDEIMALAQEHNLVVIEDAAQCPGARYKGRLAGTIGDIGVYSLNYHKHIHSGEGGMCVTNDARLATRMQLIRNHAEAVVEDMGVTELHNLIGFNFRLTELQATIVRQQLNRLNDEVTSRQNIATAYHDAFREFGCVRSCMPPDRSHAHYFQAFRFDQAAAGVSRDRFLDAVRCELQPVEGREAEGVPIYPGYIKPLYLLPIFQKRTAYAPGIAFSDDVSYEPGLCPVAEELYEKSLWYHDLTRSPLTQQDVADVCQAYVKVLRNLNELR